MMGRALAVWMVMLAVAIGNGALREGWLIPSAGERAGHQLSTVLLCIAIVLLAVLTTPWIGPENRQQALLIGVFWVGLTLAFEFLGGHYAFGKPWSELLADYDVLNGRIWVAVLITTGLAPTIAASLRALAWR